MIGLRRRTVGDFNPQLDDDDRSNKQVSPIAKALHRVDFFPKSPVGLSQRTYIGAVLSFLTIAFVAFLVISEFIMFLRVHRIDTLSVDLETNGHILIYFNISFPHIKCNDLSVDTVDATGEQHINIHHRMHKNPIDGDGKIIEVSYEPVKLGHGIMDLTRIPGSPFYCGPCYTAAPADGRQCCNTCEDVLNAFKTLGQRPPAKSSIEQCVNEMISAHPGCNMYGAMEVNKIAGNFHFAPGRSFSQEHETRVHHIHEYNPMLVGKFNSSHIIHELSFGEKIPHVVYPLDGIGASAQKSTLFKYFIKVVPTAYNRGTFHRTVDSYQFSYTKHRVDFDPQETMLMPGIFFVYDLSPIKITYDDSGDSFLHFIVSICAVIGGVFVVSSYIDRLLHFMVKGLARKQD